MRATATFHLLHSLVATLLRFATRRRYRGLEHLPRTGGAVVACNHISLADPPVLFDALIATGRRPRALAAAGLFRIPVLGWAFRTLRFVPVHRGSVNARDALAPAADALRAGDLVVIYPEGGIGRGDQHWPGPGKTGAVRLALTAGVPIVPVAQWGAQMVLPSRTRFGWLHVVAAFARRPHVQVLVGEPITLTGDPDNLEDLRAGTARVMAAITAQLEELRGPSPTHVNDPAPTPTPVVAAA